MQITGQPSAPETAQAKNCILLLTNAVALNCSTACTVWGLHDLPTVSDAITTEIGFVQMHGSANIINDISHQPTIDVRLAA